jgi:hypothetical protein
MKRVDRALKAFQELDANQRYNLLLAAFCQRIQLLLIAGVVSVWIVDRQREQRFLATEGFLQHL